MRQPRPAAVDLIVSLWPIATYCAAARTWSEQSRRSLRRIRPPGLWVQGLGAGEPAMQCHAADRYALTRIVRLVATRRINQRRNSVREFRAVTSRTNGFAPAAQHALCGPQAPDPFRPL